MSKNGPLAYLALHVHAAVITTGTEMRFIADSYSSPIRNTPIWSRTATAGSDVVQSGRPIFDDFFQHLWPYIGNNTANVVFQMVKRFWLIRIDQRLYIAPQKIV
ncbi:adhesion G protein-coupled receptor B2 [Trichonephila clavipes]|nr:adhesion G protein-coupled receptor B2 [Trichonephila clavipes]